MHTVRRVFAPLLLLLLSWRLTPPRTSFRRTGRSIGSAKAIVTGTVIDVYARRAPDGDIQTVTRVLVDEHIKGSGERTISVVQWGGHLGDEWMVQSDAPQLARGERFLLLLDRDRRGDWTPINVGLGVFRFQRDTDGSPLLGRAADIVGFDESGDEHIERPRMEQPFLAYVRAIASGKSAAADYVAGEPVTSLKKTIRADATFTGSGYTFGFGANPARRQDVRPRRELASDRHAAGPQPRHRHRLRHR